MNGGGLTVAIIHVDMDAFFASVEQRDNPDLRGKPVAVGGTPEQRGVVAAASYEARRFGVKAAMPTAVALRRCPGLVLVPADHRKYREVSGLIMQIFHSYTPLVESLSLDEAFLDVRGSERLFGPPAQIGADIRRRIGEELRLSASVGIGPNKFIAKLASDYRKPGGLTVVPPEQVREFLSPLPVERMWGAGPKTAARLKRIGVRTIGDLRDLPPDLLEQRFGKYGRVLYEFARGRDDRPVEPYRQPKSMGRETTFAADVNDPDILRQTLRGLAEQVGRSLRRADLGCRTVTLKLKYPDRKLVTRAESLPEPTGLTGPIYEAAARLLDRHCRPPVRLIGITCGRLTRDKIPTLFRDAGEIREEKITAAVDKIKDRYGEKAVRPAVLLKKPRRTY